MSTNGSGYKVLVIDDSNTIRRSAEIFLKQGGHEVLLAEDGFDALSKVNDHKPHLIFCDILMPRLDGYQTCAIIKRNAQFSNVPVVMLSSKDGVFDKARGRMVGSQDYLTKPFTKDQLLQAVQQFGVVRRKCSNGNSQSARRRRLQDRVDLPDGSAPEERLLGEDRRERRRRHAPPRGRAARPDPDGRRDARPERLPAHPRDRARPAVRRRADHHVHQQEPGNRSASGACARARATTSSSRSMRPS